MQRQNVLRVLLFLVFFSIGAAALSGAILVDDLLRYYRNQQLLRRAEDLLEQLKTLNADYDALLYELQKDPNLVKRIAPATLGTEYEDQNAVYPQVSAEQLDAARKILSEAAPEPAPKSEVPNWITRLSQPPRRIALFLAGAFLILISFVFFAPAKDHSQAQQ